MYKFKMSLQNANDSFRPMQLVANNIFDYNEGYNASVIYFELFLSMDSHIIILLDEEMRLDKSVTYSCIKKTLCILMFSLIRSQSFIFNLYAPVTRIGYAAAPNNQ